MDFVRLIQLVLRHKWLILAVVSVATTATWFGVRFRGAAYQATATLMPQEQALQTLDGVASLSNSLGAQDMRNISLQMRKSRMESLIALMMSPRVLGLLIERLGIQATPADLERLIQVKQVTSEVIRIQATAPTPEMAADLANGLASTFVQFYGDLSTTAVSESTKLLNEREAQARKELEACKTAVEKYKASRQISSLSEQLSGTLNRLNAVRQAREGTSAQLAELEAQLREVEAQLARTPEVVRVEGARWLWKISYPQYGVTSRELVLPVGRRVRFDVTATDVLHSFWIPAFRMKIDAVPGMTTRVFITPTATGSFEDNFHFRLQCAELCGLGHNLMRSPVRVVDPAEFEAWVARVKAP
ncbi:MAG: hypothetical protein K6U89_17260 [Chloroflexi bacterium]|nr:hypothetical protein [Chloroflexota bacterium]